MLGLFAASVVININRVGESRVCSRERGRLVNSAGPTLKACREGVFQDRLRRDVPGDFQQRVDYSLLY
jgi:hypothetical protein